jgi:hypothetical protein
LIDGLQKVSERVEQYCSPTSGYAWPAYDIDHNPCILTATDLLSPALLSYPIKSNYLNEMFREPTKDERPGSNSYFDLRIALERFVVSTAESQNTFEQLQLAGSETSQEWQSFKALIDLSKSTRGLTTVALTKILHRKRPSLVPLVDSRIRAFFGRRKHEDDKLFQDIQRFVKTHESHLDEWRKPNSLPNGQPMSRLRVLDIAIWMQSERL